MSSLKKLAPPPYDSLQPGDMVEQDFGPSGWVNDGPPITVKMRRLTGSEKVVGGLDTAVKFWRCWTSDPVPFNEGKTLRHATLGDLDCTSIVPYPERGITEIETKKVGS